MANKKTIFLTGGTGLLGSYLLRIFLSRGHKVYVLARDKANQTAQQRVYKILDFWDGKLPLENLKVLKGDITEPGLGFDAKTTAELIKEVDEVYHCAAVINLKWPIEKIRKINVDGTRDVLELADKCKKGGRLIKVNHISTAYIYGDYQGVFKESDLDVGQKFNTTYEQSKFEAEKVAEDFRKKGLWVDIFRPPIIIGHSKSGKIIKFYNLYQLLNLCSLGIFDSFPVLNSYAMIVPVDLVSEAIYLISEKTKDKGKNYHVFGAKQTPIDDIVVCGCRLMNIKKPKAVTINEFDLNQLTTAQKEILKKNILSVNLKNKLDSEYTRRILQDYGFSFPEIDAKLLSGILKYFVEERHLRRVGGK